MNLLRSYKDKALYDFNAEIGKIISRVKYGDSGDTNIRFNVSLCHIVVKMEYPNDFPYLFVPELKKELRRLGSQYGCPEGFCVTQDDNDTRTLIIGTTILLDPKKVDDDMPF